MENKITLNGQEYEIVLTTRAAKDISKKYGGLDKLGDAFAKDLINAMIFLTHVLVNQAIMRRNFQNPDDRKPLVTMEEIELFTDTNDLTAYLPVFNRVMANDAKEKIKTEDSEKNVMTAP